jgi:hypothetical protein
VKQLTAATYAQVWWPAVDTPTYTNSASPVWDPDPGDVDQAGVAAGGIVDPVTREPLLTWDEALDQLDHIDPDAVVDKVRPRHVVRFGEQIDARSVLAGSPEAERCIGHLVKYVKDLGKDLDPVPVIDPHRRA